MIKKIIIENFKCINGRFELDFNEGINILVGDNEAGKSTILEAIHLALSGIFRGRLIKGNINQYLFNYNIVKEYLNCINKKRPSVPPYFLIELYMGDTFPELEGDMYTDENLQGRAYGISMRVGLDEKV
jgi:putative ATP-dependent endonuclease of OLD family